MLRNVEDFDVICTIPRTHSGFAGGLCSWKDQSYKRATARDHGACFPGKLKGEERERERERDGGRGRGGYTAAETVSESVSDCGVQ